MAASGSNTIGPISAGIISACRMGSVIASGAPQRTCSKRSQPGRAPSPTRADDPGVVVGRIVASGIGGLRSRRAPPGRKRRVQLRDCDAVHILALFKLLALIAIANGS